MEKEINKTINESIMEESHTLNINTSHSKKAAEKTLKESVISNYPHDKFSIMNNAPDGQIFTFEFLSSFALVFGVTCFSSEYEIDAQTAGAVLLAVCFGGTLCGANINPAVTISNIFKKQNKYRCSLLPSYILAQILGALLGVFLAELFNGSRLHPLEVDGLSESIRAIFNEAMGVFVLVFFLLQISNPNTTFIENEISGFVSIALFYHIARTFAPNANYCINPAISIALAIQYATKGEFESLKNLPLWLVGDLVGTVAGTLFYDKLYEPIIKELREVRRHSEIFASIKEEDGISLTGSESSTN